MIYIISLFLFYIFIAYAYGILFRTLFKGFIKDIEGIHLLYPFFGFSFLVAISQLLGIFLGAKFYNPFIILGGIIILFVVLYNSLIKKNEISIQNSTEKLYYASFFGIVFLIYFFPSLFAGFPTSFASINNDLIFYLSIPEWLIEKGYFTNAISDSFHPFFSIAEIHFSRFSRVGADYFNTLGMTFFHTDAMHTFNVISCFFVFLFSLSVYYTCKYSFRLSNSIVLTAVTLSTINTLLFWMFTTQYMPQIGGNAFYVLSAGFIYRVIKEKKINLVVPTSLSIAGLIAVYSEYTLYLLVPAMMFFVFSVFKDYKNTRLYTKILFYIMFLAVIFNPVSTFIALRYNIFAYTSTQNSVGIVEYIPFFNQILMVFGFKSLDYSSTSGFYIIIGSLLLIFVIIGSLIAKKEIKVYLMIYSLFIVALLLYLHFINKFPYGYYKTLMFAQPFVILLFSIGFNYLAMKLKASKYLQLGILALVLLSNCFQISKLENIILYKGLLVTKEYTEVKEINKLIPEDEILSIEDVTKDEEHILSFLLKNTNISFKNSNSYFAPSSIPEGSKSSYTLKGSGDILNYDGFLIWHNEKFSLYKDFNISMDEGWHGLEDWNGIPTRWTKSEFSLSAKVLNTNKVSISFNAVLPPNVTERTILLYVNGEFVEEKKVTSNTILTTSNLNIELNKVNNIKFIVKEGAVRVGQDTRELGIAVQNIKVFEN
ncbi:hypothetical protein [Paenibacillus sp. GCM10012306]|uniref:hypothetical protein n=1 Tax=Paenibacillus sp. GCM10012306 TaxID=3317342 RepID=UPI003605BC9E